MVTPSLSLGSRGPGVLLVAFTLLGLGFLAYFEWNDGRPPTYDDAWYLETSLRMYDALSEARLAGFVREYCGAFGGSKAPLISVIPLPFYFLFGKRIDPTFWVNGVFLIAGNFCLYGLVRRWYPAVVGLVAVVVYQTFPIVAGLSRAPMTDYGLAALVVVFLYCLSAPCSFGSARWVLLLGILLGLGLLMKILFPAFVVGPLLAVWLSSRNRDSAWAPGAGATRWQKLERFAVAYPLWSIGLIGGLVASSWYALNLRRALAFAWGNSFGSIVDNYRAPSLAAWLLDLAREGVSPYYALGLLLFVPAAFAILWRRGEVGWKPRHLLLLSWFGPAAVAVVAVQHSDLRLVMPILPVAAIALARGMAVLASAMSRQAWARATLLSALLALPIYGFARLTFGGPPIGEALYHGTYWYRLPDQYGQWNQLRILDALRELGPDSPAAYDVVIGVDHPYLNANLLNYLRSREGGAFSFQGFGYAETSVGRAVESINKPNVRFLLMAEGFEQSDLPAFLNRVNDGVEKMLEQNRLPFQYRTTIHLTGRVGVRFYERAPASEPGT